MIWSTVVFNGVTILCHNSEKFSKLNMYSYFWYLLHLDRCMFEFKKRNRTFEIKVLSSLQGEVYTVENRIVFQVEVADSTYISNGISLRWWC